MKVEDTKKVTLYRNRKDKKCGIAIFISVCDGRFCIEKDMWGYYELSFTGKWYMWYNVEGANLERLLHLFEVNNSGCLLEAIKSRFADRKSGSMVSDILLYFMENGIVYSGYDVEL